MSSRLVLTCVQEGVSPRVLLCVRRCVFLIGSGDDTRKHHVLYYHQDTAHIDSHLYTHTHTPTHPHTHTPTHPHSHALHPHAHPRTPTHTHTHPPTHTHTHTHMHTHRGGQKDLDLRLPGPHFTCFTSIKVQILTQKTLLAGQRWFGSWERKCKCKRRRLGW